MGTKTIMYDRIVPPGGEFRPRTRVRVRLVAADSGEGTGYNSIDRRTIVGVADELLDSELFVVDLDAQASISAPANTAYEITRVYPGWPAPPAETFTAPTEPTPTSTTQAVTLPAANIAASTTGFASSGAVYLSGQLVTYTATTPTAFTGCTGGAGLIPSGTSVRQAHWIASHLTNPPTGLPNLHVDNPAGAHAASAVAVAPTGGLVATTAQAALAELDGEVAAEAALARNADNLTSGTVADARIAASIARDSEVSAAVAAEAALRETGDTTRSANQQVANYTLVLSDAGKAVEGNAAGALNFTVPPNSSVAYPTGTIIEVVQVGAGAVSLVQGSGVTITGDTVTPGTGGSLLLRKTGTNAWFSAIASVRSGTFVATTGAETIAGVKTFSSAPVVPDASFSEAKVSGLTAALAAKEVASLLTSRLYVDPVNGSDAGGIYTGRSPGRALATVQQALSIVGGNAAEIIVPPFATMTLPDAGIVVPARKRIVADSPDGAVLTYNGTGAAVSLTGGRYCSLRGVKVLTTNAAATVRGVVIDASVASCNYFKLLDLIIAANTKVAGQIGLRLVNTPTTSIYWPDVVSLHIENFGTSIKFDNDVTFGINAGSWMGVKLHNADTCLDLGTADGHMFHGVKADLFTLGISCDGVRNHIYGRFEGGGASKCYELLSASQENVLVVDDNCATASTDVGTENIVITLASGKPKAYETPNQFLAPFFPGSANGDGTVHAGGNNAEWVKLPGVTRRTAVTKIRFEVTVQSGNIDVGIYELSGTTLTRLVSSGSTACPAVGAKEITIASTVLRAGRTYYLALAADNLTAKFKSLIGVATNLLGVGGGNLLYASTGGGNLPLPASILTTALSTHTVCFCLIARA